MGILATDEQLANELFLLTQQNRKKFHIPLLHHWVILVSSTFLLNKMIEHSVLPITTRSNA